MRNALFALLFIACTATPPAPEPPAAGTAENAESAMIITGTVTDEGVECPAVRTADGKLYTIATADREKLRPGTRVRITGEIAQMSICQQGTTLSAEKVEILK
ncbi:MAG TPA: DUF5818 domain-containing protein [Thermoanaerobaculia bacterium]|nr:DUF5818 domain-containing protein [Thermoanaerobaculia bacterium]